MAERILEPSMGVSGFFGNMPDEMKSGSYLYGVEEVGRVVDQHETRHLLEGFRKIAKSPVMLAEILELMYYKYDKIDFISRMCFYTAIVVILI